MNIAGEIELKIVLAPGKDPQVTGPLTDRMLCYAMLEIARDAIKDYKPGPASLIEPARFVGLPVNNGHR